MGAKMTVSEAKAVLGDCLCDLEKLLEAGVIEPDPSPPTASKCDFKRFAAAADDYLEKLRAVPGFYGVREMIELIESLSSVVRIVHSHDMELSQ